MNKQIPRKILTIIAAYAMAAYIERIAFTIYMFANYGVTLQWLFSVKGIKALVLSPISFPFKLLPFFYVKSMDGFVFYLKLSFASLVTFAAAFIGFYFIFTNMQRPRNDRPRSWLWD
jgi:hypothetical protein